jgi:hypothetical protein
MKDTRTTNIEIIKSETIKNGTTKNGKKYTEYYFRKKGG